MSKLTKQGIRDLNSLGNVNKKSLNGRKDKGQNECFHVFEDYLDDDYVAFKRCQKCNYEEV